MKIGIIGTGEVGRQLGARLAGLGHTVAVGSRTTESAELASWAADAGVEYTTFAQAAVGAELVVNATGGLVSVSALSAVGAQNLDGKVLLDVSNPLDFSAGLPPKVPTAEGGISIAESIQRAFPGARVVKSLNTVASAVMVDPARVPGRHNIFVSGEDQQAKATVTALLGEFGWLPEQVVDLGGLSTARGLEQYIGLWLGMFGALGTLDFNIALQVRREG